MTQLNMVGFKCSTGSIMMTAHEGRAYGKLRSVEYVDVNDRYKSVERLHHDGGTDI